MKITKVIKSSCKTIFVHVIKVCMRWRNGYALKGAIFRYKPTTLFGKYRVLSTLGTGNSSTVYLAEHIRLNVYRAIKCIPKDTSLVSSPSSEATLLKNLNHPGIPLFTILKKMNISFISSRNLFRDNPLTLLCHIKNFP